MSQYDGRNTVDWIKASEIRARGELMGLMLDKHRAEVRRVTEMESGRPVYRYVFPQAVLDARRKLLSSLERMSRRETP